MPVIYHLARRRDWQAAKSTGAYRGAREDRDDGFMHFSTAAQIAGSAAKHPRGETDRIYMEERIQAFLVDAVKNRTP